MEMVYKINSKKRSEKYSWAENVSKNYSGMTRRTTSNTCTGRGTCANTARYDEDSSTLSRGSVYRKHVLQQKRPLSEKFAARAYENNARSWLKNLS